MYAKICENVYKRKTFDDVDSNIALKVYIRLYPNGIYKLSKKKRKTNTVKNFQNRFK